MSEEYDTQLHEQVGAYVLDALPQDELVAFEEHLRSCSDCLSEARELRAVVDALPLALPLMSPPAELRDRIMAAVEEDGVDRPALRAIRGGVPARSQSRRWTRLPGMYLTVAAVAVIAALGMWNVRLQSRVTQQQAAVNVQQMVSKALNHHDAVYPVGATSPTSNATAYMVQPPGKASAYLIVRDLPKPAQNKVYQLWLMSGGVPRSEGTFTYAGSDPHIIHLKSGLSGYGRTAVSVEPAPYGSAKGPTGPVVLLGKLGA